MIVTNFIKSQLFQNLSYYYHHFTFFFVQQEMKSPSRSYVQISIQASSKFILSLFKNDTSVALGERSSEGDFIYPY